MESWLPDRRPKPAETDGKFSPFLFRVNSNLILKRARHSHRSKIATVLYHYREC